MTGEIDMATADLLHELFSTVAKRKAKAVIVDLTRVSFMDSTGLHALIAGKRMIRDDGSRLFLVPSPQVRRLLELTFPDPLFAVRVDTVEEAVEMIDASHVAGGGQLVALE